MKRRWLAEGEGWEVFDFIVDFRVGGAESSHFSFQGGPEVSYDATFQDIVTDRRIVFVYRMAVAGKPISVSLATVELAPSGSGTRLTYTEQGAYFDDPGAPQGREVGSRELLEKLAEELARSTQPGESGRSGIEARTRAPIAGCGAGLPAVPQFPAKMDHLSPRSGRYLAPAIAPSLHPCIRLTRALFLALLLPSSSSADTSRRRRPILASVRTGVAMSASQIV